MVQQGGAHATGETRETGEDGTRTGKDPEPNHDRNIRQPGMKTKRQMARYVAGRRADRQRRYRDKKMDLGHAH